MKKILVLAFVSAAFLFSCSADIGVSGTTSPPKWSGGPASTPSTPGGGGGGYVKCLYNGTCYEDVPREECIYAGGSVVSSCPSSSGQYCLYYSYGYVCDLIGGKYIDTVSECYNYYDGDVVSKSTCEDYDADIYN